MSYILDALKKSDQQRQRGATPTLQIAQITVATPKRPLFVYYSLLATVLLGVGITIGWLRPWQAEQTPAEAEPVVAETTIPVVQLDAPESLPASAEVIRKAAQEIAVTNSTPAAAAVKDKSATPVEVSQKQAAIRFDELPLTIQQEIPAMDIQLHAYSSKSGERLVSINSIRLREGGSLMSGLRLEQITPDGMIFSYKGYSFQRGIR